MEPTFVETFKENPVFIALALVLGAAGLMLTVLGFVLRKGGGGRGLAIAAATTGFAAIGAGLWGARSTQHRATEFLTLQDLSDRDRARWRDYSAAEARYNLVAGIAAGAVPVVSGIALAFLRRPRGREGI